MVITGTEAERSRVIRVRIAVEVLQFTCQTVELLVLKLHAANGALK